MQTIRSPRRRLTVEAAAADAPRGCGQDDQTMVRIALVDGRVTGAAEGIVAMA